MADGTSGVELIHLEKKKITPKRNFFATKKKIKKTEIFSNNKKKILHSVSKKMTISYK